LVNWLAVNSIQVWRPYFKKTQISYNRCKKSHTMDFQVSSVKIRKVGFDYVEKQKLRRDMTGVF